MYDDWQPTPSITTLILEYGLMLIGPNVVPKLSEGSVTFPESKTRIVGFAETLTVLFTGSILTVGIPLMPTFHGPLCWACTVPETAEVPPRVMLPVTGTGSEVVLMTLTLAGFSVCPSLVPISTKKLARITNPADAKR